MATYFQINRIQMMFVMFFAVCSVYSQNHHHTKNNKMNNDEAVDGIKQNAASSYGSRVSSSLFNREFPAEMSVSRSTMGKIDKGNNMKYNPQITTLEKNQETNFRTSSRGSDRKKAKRMQKMKTALYNIHKNTTNTWHSIDPPLRNSGFSDGYTIHVNSRSRESSGIDKFSNVLHIPKVSSIIQEVSDLRNRTSANTVGVRNGAVDLKQKKTNSPLFTLNNNGFVKVSNEHLENEASFPCSCFWSKEKCGCTCNDSLIYDDFQKLSKIFRPCSNFSFAIIGGHHFSLPPNLFTQIGQVQSIHIKITNATFDYLFDATPYTSAFRGVSFENDALIELLGVRVRRGWNWTPLEYLNSSSGAGVEIRLEGCGLRRLSSDFGKVADGKVRTARISDSRLEMIGSGAFSSFNDLTHFMLPRNRLRDIKRSDLPMEPLYLVEIDLRNNQLQSLEADLFSEMPSLQTISLAGNPLRVLPEATFSNIIGRASVPGLSDFPLNCDCQLRWLKNSSYAHNDQVLNNLKGLVCKRPPHLRGTPFKDLSKEHLMC